MTGARTVIIREQGGPEVLRLETLPLRDPGEGEILIRHHAIGLNFIDIYQRSGLYRMPLPTPLGLEAAGVVEAVGPGVTHLRPGDRAAYATAEPGALSEARVMKAAQVVPLPDAIPFETAAAAMLKGLTVNYLFRRTVPIARGERVLFHAAAGGVGLIACQWARDEGVELIATAGSDEKCALALEHGAAHAINYRREDWVARVGAITGGAGVGVVMDSVGADTFDGSLSCLAPLGMMISFGNASGPVPPVDLLRLSARSLKITRPTIFTHIADPDTCRAMAGELFDKLLSGAVTMRIDRTFPLAEIARAQEALAARRTTGSTVILP